jgi:hypothetical protein
MEDGLYRLIFSATAQCASSFASICKPRPVALSGLVINPQNSCLSLDFNAVISGLATGDDDAISTFKI